MKAKILTIVMTLMLCMGFVGCGNNAQESGGDEVVLKENQICIQDTVVTLDDSMDVIKEKLGEPLEYSESKSCMYDGYDKVYTYSDVKIITYPKDGGEYINSITVLSNNVETGCGILIGDTADAIKEKYAEDEMVITKSCFMYETDSFGMAFYLEDDVVAEIEIYTMAE